MRRIARWIVVVTAALVMVSAVGAPVAAQGEVLYLTKFLDPAEDASDWGFPRGATEVAEDGYTAAFTEGALTVTLDGTPTAWLYPDDLELPANQAVEARIASSIGDDSALFGVACRADLPSAGYVFLVGTDGYYTIGRYRRGAAKAIVNAKGTKRTDAVDPEGFNLVRGECVGKKKVTLTLFVNGEEVASFVDKKPPKRVGRSATVVTEVADGESTTTEFTGFAVSRL
jgi:hypothetical protein